MPMYHSLSQCPNYEGCTQCRGDHLPHRCTALECATTGSCYICGSPSHTKRRCPEIEAELPHIHGGEQQSASTEEQELPAGVIATIDLTDQDYLSDASDDQPAAIYILHEDNPAERAYAAAIKSLPAAKEWTLADYDKEGSYNGDILRSRPCRDYHRVQDKMMPTHECPIIHKWPYCTTSNDQECICYYFFTIHSKACEKAHNLFLAANGHTEEGYEDAMFIARSAYVRAFMDHRERTSATD